MKEMISLGDLAREFGINKSQLAYYHQFGLLSPIMNVGKTNVFDRKETVRRIALIQKSRKEGKSLAEVKQEINK